MSTRPEIARGLEGVVVNESSICQVDGEKGELLYRGYSIAELAGRTSFEEAAHLLWFGELPGRAAAAELGAALAEARRLPRDVLDHLRGLPRGAQPIDVVRTLCSLLGIYDREAALNTAEANTRKSVRLTGALAAGIAAFHRIRTQMPVLDSRPTLGHAADFLWLLSGEVPSPAAARAFDTALLLHMEHSFNASTFAARVTASTLSDLHAAVTSAAGTLKGPLHGGANEKVLPMLAEAASPARAADYVRGKIERKERLMGFGHRIYKTEDPRARVLRGLAGEVARARGLGREHETAVAIEQAVNRELGERGIAVNVDFYSALLYHGLGIPTDCFTPVFAVARVVGWTAHVMEQLGDNRLIRPKAAYVGPPRRALPPADARG